MNNYRQSKNWDMEMSLNELINYNKTCKIDLNSTHHFDTYNGILIYVTHPQVGEPFSIELGVDKYGIMYEGDGCTDGCEEIPIEEGLKILEQYKKLVETKTHIEWLLFNNNLDKNVIDIKMR